MYRSHSGNDGPVVPTEVNQQITAVQDALVLNMAKMFMDITELQSKIAIIESQGLTPGAIRDAMNALKIQEEQAINRLTEDSSNERYAESAMARIDEAAAAQEQNIIHQAEISEQVAQIDEKIANASAAIHDQTQAINQTTQAVDAALAQEIADARDVSIKKGDACSGGGFFSFFYDIVCSIENMISGVFGGVAGVFRLIFNVILYLIIGYLIYKLLMSDACAKCLHGASSSLSSKPKSRSKSKTSSSSSSSSDSTDTNGRYKANYTPSETKALTTDTDNISDTEIF